jgi:hypothetical protein
MTQSHTVKLILLALTDSLYRQGWGIERILRSRRIYTKSSVVTPYFYCEAAHRNSGGTSYTLDGAVGVIHRGFEESWARSPAGKGTENVFAVVSHIANFRAIRPTSFIRPENIEEDVNRFVNELSPFLECMPKTEDDLVIAFRRDELCGEKLTMGFSGNPNEKKFSSFREFVNHLPIPRALKN